MAVADFCLVGYILLFYIDFALKLLRFNSVLLSWSEQNVVFLKVSELGVI